MSERIWTVKGREKLPPGPWQNEVDRMEFGAHGFTCVIVRPHDIGHLCGYVGVPPGHPWHGKGYDELYQSGTAPEAHGGLTYAASARWPVSSAHEPDDRWYLGFDCAHAGDLCPGMLRYGRHSGDVYRDMHYVIDECERLAEQAEAAADAADAEMGRS